jgi:hypothetical protein
MREQNRKTLRQAIHVWLDQYPEDLQEPPNYPCLSQLETFCSRVMPDSELDQKVPMYIIVLAAACLLQLALGWHCLVEYPLKVYLFANSINLSLPDHDCQSPLCPLFLFPLFFGRWMHSSMRLLFAVGCSNVAGSTDDAAANTIRCWCLLMSSTSLVNVWQTGQGRQM